MGRLTATLVQRTWRAVLACRWLAIIDAPYGPDFGAMATAGAVPGRSAPLRRALPTGGKRAMGRYCVNCLPVRYAWFGAVRGSEGDRFAKPHLGLVSGRRTADLVPMLDAAADALRERRYAAYRWQSFAAPEAVKSSTRWRKVAGRAYWRGA